MYCVQETLDKKTHTNWKKWKTIFHGNGKNNNNDNCNGNTYSRQNDFTTKAITKDKKDPTIWLLVFYPKKPKALIWKEWSKSDRERQIPYDFTYMWNPKSEINKQNRNNLIDTEKKLMVVR